MAVQVFFAPAFGVAARSLRLMDMAHPFALSGDTHVGLGARGAASKFLSHRSSLLVSALGVGRSAMSYGTASFYVFGTAVHCSALGALLTFSTVLWYPAYENTTRFWGLTALQDQQLGGLVMWVPSAAVFILIGLLLFARWVVEAENRQQHSSLQAVLNTAKGDQL